MLNTDAHNPMVTKKMTKADFVRMNSSSDVEEHAPTVLHLLSKVYKFLLYWFLGPLYATVGCLFCMKSIGLPKEELYSYHGKKLHQCLIYIDTSNGQNET